MLDFLLHICYNLLYKNRKFYTIDIWEVRIMVDVVIIGAGAVGCAAAMELSRYRLSVCVVDKESDVCEGTTKANSAIVHAGFDAGARYTMEYEPIAAEAVEEAAVCLHQKSGNGALL